jgi:hypothetical protein
MSSLPYPLTRTAGVNGAQPEQPERGQFSNKPITSQIGLVWTALRLREHIFSRVSSRIYERFAETS